jgi:LacI family transcriptional regulator
MLESAERTLSARGVGVLIRFAGPGSALDCAGSLAAFGVDGVMFIGPDPPAGTDGWSAGKVPCVGCDPHPGEDEAGGVGETVEARGLALAVQYLRQLGHRRIGAINRREEDGGGEPGQPNGAITIIHRPVDTLQDPDTVRAAVRLLLGNDVTAIVSGSDAAAAGILRECRVLELAVPREISVIGWGDTGLARCLDPPLTSIRVPASAMGKAAAENLLAIMTGDPFRWPELSPRLVIRESAGPAPG